MYQLQNYNCLASTIPPPTIDSIWQIPHVDKSRQTEQNVPQSVTSRVSSVSQPQSPEQTLRLNAHLNRTPVIFQDKWPVQTEVASTAAALQREHENQSSNSAGQLGPRSCVGSDKQAGSDLLDGLLMLLSLSNINTQGRRSFLWQIFQFVIAVV